jgi:hypothetical protein
MVKNVEQKPNEFVRWVFRGFRRGRGKLRFLQKPTRRLRLGVRGNCSSVAVLFSPPIERLFLERRFNVIWEIDWHRLRKREAGR